MPFRTTTTRRNNSFSSWIKDPADPITKQLLLIAIDESEEQRLVREKEEQTAQNRSQEIDEWLSKERQEKEKQRKKGTTSKILLVGQSESGKSTTLKNFQLQYSPQAFKEEQAAWKTVIHLNLVRSVRKIHEALSTYASSQIPQSNVIPTTPLNTPIWPHMPKEEDKGESSSKQPDLSTQHRLLLLRLRPVLSLEPQLLKLLVQNPSKGVSSSHGLDPSSKTTSLQVPTSFWGREFPDDVPQSSTSGMFRFQPPPSPNLAATQSPESYPSPPPSSRSKPVLIPSGDEVCLRAGWKLRIPKPLSRSRSRSGHLMPPSRVVHDVDGNGSLQDPWTVSPQKRRRSVTTPTRLSPHPGVPAPLIITRSEPNMQIHPDAAYPTVASPPATPDSEVIYHKPNIRQPSRTPSPSIMSHNDPTEVPDRILSACAPDITALWTDVAIKKILCSPVYAGGLGLKIHEDAGFFLDDIERVTAANYIPTDDDVLRARLKTMGISEHRFTLEAAKSHDLNLVNELVVYDVGGSRTQRHQWIPFFEDMDIIIFLAPVCSFDQRLAEDPTVNRLHDTFKLWKDICKSPLLIGVDFLVFLNKCDLLEARLNKGIKLKRWIPQYSGDNSLVDVIKFFRDIFLQIWQRSNARLKFPDSAHKRTIHVYNTSVIDARATKTVILNVQECAMRSNLRSAGVI